MQTRGRRWQHPLPLVLLCFSVLTLPAAASPSLWGDTGLIAAPSDQILEGDLALGYSRTFGPRSFHSAPVPNNVYFLNLSLLPRFEFVLLFNQVITGRQDSDTPYLHESSLDRSMNLKLQLVREGEWVDWSPTVVLGARDPFGNSEANIGPQGLTSTVHSRAYYGVVGKTFAGWHLHAGYAWGPSQMADPWVVVPGGQGDFHLRGLFGGVESPSLFDRLRFMAEYDSRRLNFGLSVGPFYGLVLKPVLIDLYHFNVGASWTARI